MQRVNWQEEEEEEEGEKEEEEVRIGENAKPIEQRGHLHSPVAAPAQPQNG